MDELSDWICRHDYRHALAISAIPIAKRPTVMACCHCQHSSVRGRSARIIAPQPPAARAQSMPAPRAAPARRYAAHRNGALSVNAGPSVNAVARAAEPTLRAPRQAGCQKASPRKLRHRRRARALNGRRNWSVQQRLDAEAVSFHPPLAQVACGRDLSPQPAKDFQRGRLGRQVCLQFPHKSPAFKNARASRGVQVAAKSRRHFHGVLPLVTRHERGDTVQRRPPAVVQVGGLVHDCDQARQPNQRYGGKRHERSFQKASDA